MHLVPPLLAPLLRGGTKRGELVCHNNTDHHRVTAHRLHKVLPRILDPHLLHTRIPMVRNHHHIQAAPVLHQGVAGILNHPLEQDLRWLILV